MTDELWNPMPNNTARPAATKTPRARGEELWRLIQVVPVEGGTYLERVATCELRDDSTVVVGWEVVVRHDDEIMIGRRCGNEAEARYYGETFRQDYARSGWTK